MEGAGGGGGEEEEEEEEEEEQAQDDEATAESPQTAAAEAFLALGDAEPDEEEAGGIPAAEPRETLPAAPRPALSRPLAKFFRVCLDALQTIRHLNQQTARICEEVTFNLYHLVFLEKRIRKSRFVFRAPCCFALAA